MCQNFDIWFLLFYCLLMLVFSFFLLAFCHLFCYFNFLLSSPFCLIFYCLSFFHLFSPLYFRLLWVLSLAYPNLLVTKFWGRHTDFVSFFFLWFWYEEDTLIFASFSSFMFPFSIFLLCRTAWTYCLMFPTTRFLEGSFSCVYWSSVVGYRLHH
jgi:hypothetical protein